MRHWKVIIKEVGNPHPIETEMIGDYDEYDVVKHYGLRNPDVQWYKMQEINFDVTDQIR